MTQLSHGGKNLQFLHLGEQEEPKVQGHLQLHCLLTASLRNLTASPIGKLYTQNQVGEQAGVNFRETIGNLRILEARVSA